MAYQEQDAYGRLWQTKLTANDSTPIEGAEKLGAVRELADGRRFRYVQMTGTAGALGELLMPATLVTVTDATSASGTGPDGATTTIITDADAAFTADAYINWYFQLATSMTGSTEPLKIVGNSATTLTLEKSIATALASGGTDDGEILAGTAAGILSSASDLDVAVIGVCVGTLTQNYYGWVQVAGPAAVMSDALGEGESVCPGGNADGQAISADTDADNNIIGVCIGASGTNENGLVDLRIA
ncbi:hypothetical protein LCGC14_1930740 [marine sediment metagenome]|uniref:Uncharacterized protein n=2 Tax=root TaxID=1 RepID=A0A0F9I201_9ZZZZ